VFLLGYYSVEGRVFDPVFRRLAIVDRPEILWRVFLLAVSIGFLPLLVIAQGNVLAILEDALVPSARWSGMFQRGRFGGAKDAFLELQMFLRAAIPLASAVIVLKRHSQAQRFIAGLFLVFVFARAFNSGTRSQVIEVFLPIAAAIYWRMSIKMKQNAIRFGLPTLAALIMFWSAATVVTRNSGNFDWEKASEAKYVGFEMFRELLFLQTTVPETSDHKWGHTYLVQIVNPIPRFLWPGKPTGDAGLELAGLQGQVVDGQATLTISPGLIGEMYWNFGVPGIIVVSFLLGHLARSWDRVEPLAEKSIVAFTVFAAGLAIIFLSGRSINMATLYGMLALVALLVFFTKK
jgi:oligosaccharide repeat unit polymerase